MKEEVWPEAPRPDNVQLVLVPLRITARAVVNTSAREQRWVCPVDLLLLELCRFSRMLTKPRV